MSNDGLIFVYGEFGNSDPASFYEHLKGEVYPDRLLIQPQYSPDGKRWADKVQMQVAGNFVNVNPELTAEEVNTRIAELEAAYQQNYKDAGFFFSAGYDPNSPADNRTEHYLLTDSPNNLSGNQITYRSWDNATSEELANTRSFRIHIDALIRNLDDNLIFFEESSTRLGDGGPVWKLYNDWTGNPIKEQIFAQSKVRHIQQGTIIRMDTWAAPPQPYWPSDEQTWKQRIIQTTPKIWGPPGDVSASKRTHYRLDYFYYFERITATDPGPGS